MKMSVHAALLTMILAALSVSGCATFNDSVSRTFHDLKPHRLWRLNRHPAPRRDVYYSVPDPVPALGPSGPAAPVSGSPAETIRPQTEK